MCVCLLVVLAGCCVSLWGLRIYAWIVCAWVGCVCLCVDLNEAVYQFVVVLSV